MVGFDDGAGRVRAPSEDELFTVRVLGVVRDLETLLEARGASGRGLHEKVTSVAGRLPDGTERQLRFIATVRNKLVHEGGFRLPERDQARFIEAAETTRTTLERLMRSVDDRVELTSTDQFNPVVNRQSTVSVRERRGQRSSARESTGNLMTIVIVAILLLLMGGVAVPAWHWVADAVVRLVAVADASRSGAP